MYIIVCVDANVAPIIDNEPLLFETKGPIMIIFLTLQLSLYAHYKLCLYSETKIKSVRE